MEDRQGGGDRVAMKGEQISHFQIVGPLGSGGMGVVYRAFDVDLQRSVALKILPEDWLDDDRARERFLREARAASALNHRHIVTVYEVGTEQERDYIAMELVEGRSLGEVIAEGRISPLQVVRWASQITMALECAHRRGIVHRDLKPQNVMITEDGEVKVLDFGLAKRLGPTGFESDPELPTWQLTSEHATAEGAIVGTPHYMSPEQAQGLPADARSDLFSLGSVLYEMLSGKRPFEGTNPISVLTAVIRQPAPALSGALPEVPAALERVVARCHEKEVEERYSSSSALLVDLRDLEEMLVSYPDGSDRRWRLKAGVALIAGLVAILAVFGIGWWREKSQPPASRGATSLRLLFDSSAPYRDADFSPDGSRLAFVSPGEDGVPQIWVSDLDGADRKQLTHGESPVGRPRWSSVEREIAYCLQSSGIWSVSAEGGTPKPLVQAACGHNFSRDGERLVFERDRRIWIANADGTAADPVAGVLPDYFTAVVSRNPAFSPDGSELVYFQPDEGPYGDLWVVSSQGGAPRRLTDIFFQGGSPVWSPDGLWIVYSSSQAGAFNIWRVPVDGGPPEPLTTGAGDDRSPALAPDGRRLIYTNVRDRHAVAITEPKSGEEATVLERRFAIGFPRASPDGKTVAFFGPDEEGGTQLFVVDRAGGPQRQLTHNDGQKSVSLVPQWSSDGAALTFYRDRPEPSFRRLDLATGSETTLFDGWRWTRENGAHLDPSGSELVYTLMTEGRPRETRIRSLAGGKEERTLSLPLWGVQWSPDGRFIVGTDLDGSLQVCAPRGDDCHELVVGQRPRWSVDGAWVYFVGPISGVPVGTELYRVAVEGGEPQHMATLRPLDWMSFYYDVLADGAILWSRFLPGSQELWIADLE